VPTNVDRDVLHVSIARAKGTELWQKTISTTLVHRRPQWPEFGAVETKLRYDARISVRADDGTFSSMSCADAWDGRTLWLNHTLREQTTLRLTFGASPER